MMKKSYLILFAITHSFVLFSQPFYSTLTPTEKEIDIRESFTFNEANYILANEFNPLDSMFSEDAIIAEVTGNGEIQTRKNLGSIRYGWNTVFEEDGQLIIAGQTDTSIWLKIFDASFNILSEKEFGLANEAGSFVTRKIIPFKDSYIFIGDNGGFEVQESSLMIKVSKADLEVTRQSTISVVGSTIDLTDVKVFNTDSLIQLVAIPDDNPFIKIVQFEIKDDQLKTCRKIETNSIGYFSEFEIINDNQIVYNSFPTSIQCINMLGDSLWNIDIEEEFSGFDVFASGIQEIQKDMNGDILACGYLDRFDQNGDAYVSSLIIKISKFGEVIWKRTLRPGADGFLLSTQLESILAFDSCYLFTGNSINHPVVGLPNYAWALKTNLDGCIEGNDCPEDQLLSTQSFDKVREDLFAIKNTNEPNALHLEVLTHESLSFSLYSSVGEKVMSSTILYKGVHALPLTAQSGLFVIVGSTDKGIIQSEKIWIK